MNDEVMKIEIPASLARDLASYGDSLKAPEPWMVDALRFALSEPAQPVEAVDVLIAMDANGSFFLHTPDGRVWRGDDWITFGPAEIYPDYKSAMKDRKVAIAALTHPRPTGDVTPELIQAFRDGFGKTKDYAPTGEQAGEVVAGDMVKNAHAWLKLIEGELTAKQFAENGDMCWKFDLRKYVRLCVNQLATVLAQTHPEGVPDGWKLVPVKAMHEITEAGRKSLIESGKANVTYDTTAAYAYEEMVAAAPAPAKAGEV